MKLWIIIAALTLSTAVLAVGGGGGGDSGGGGGGSTSSFCSGLCDIQCLDTGALKFRSDSFPTNMVATFTETGETIPVEGNWIDNRFTSNEALFRKQGSYNLNGFNFVCPGLKFSCAIVNITPLSCRNAEGRIEVGFSLKDSDGTQNMAFKFTSGNIIFSQSGSVRDPQVKAFSIAQASGVYTANVTTDSKASDVTVYDTRCTTKKYTITCNEGQAATPAAVEARTFACYELDALEDRVRCRLSLNPAQQEEELRVQYLPEECRALGGADRDSCVHTYDSVQGCWGNPEGEARVGCVKQVLGFTNVAQEKAKCGADAGCKEAIKKDIFTLVKFRLYDLEERAEELYDKYPDAVSSFVSSVEFKKQAFNVAPTIDQKKQVVLEVRTLWKDFLKAIA